MKRWYSLFILGIILLNTRGLQAQWKQSEGIYGGWTQSLVTLDSTLFICAGYNGIYSRNFSDTTWESRFAGGWFWNIKRCGDALFAYDWSHCYRSLDHGNTWQNMVSYWGTEVATLCMIDTVLFFSSTQELYRSDDKGVTITPVSNNLPGLLGPSLSASEGTLFCFNNNLTDNKLYQSSNLGDSWDSIQTEGLPSGWGQQDMCMFNGTIRIVTYDRVYRYNPVQGNWVLEKDGVSFSHMKEMNGLLCACSNLNGFYRYVPGAGQWIPSNTGFESLTVWDFSAFGPVLFAATSAGPFISVPPYLSWQSFYDGLTQVDIDRIFAHDSTIWALSEVKAYCSTDNGMHFTPHSFESLSLPRQMILSDSIYFMIAADSVYISSDQGNTWVDISNGLPYNPQPPLLHLNSLAVSGNFLFLGTSDGLFRTEHHNYQWMQIPSLNSPNLKSIDLVLHDSILLVIKGVGADDLRYYLFRSVDAGDTFDSVSGLSPVYFPLIEAGQEDFFASVFHELFRSTDGGASWTEVPAGCPSGRVTGIAVKEPSMILAGINFASFSPCLTVTYDNGQNWINIYENLPWSGWPEVNLVEINQERVFAAPLGNGLWYQGNVLTGDEMERGILSKQMRVVPNPTNGPAAVHMELTEMGTGSLSIIGMNGKVVHKIENVTVKQGRNTIPINVQGFSPGLYFVEFISKQGTLTGKLSVMK